MNRPLLVVLFAAILCAAAGAQQRPEPEAGGIAAPPAAAEPAAAVPDPAVLRWLAQIEQNAQLTAELLQRMRVGRWRADGSVKEVSESRVESVQRNIQAALPELLGDVRKAPEGIAASFRLYRNLNALYDVLAALAESTGAYGSRDDFEELLPQVEFFDRARRAFADRVEALAVERDVELARLRRSQQQNPPKKIIIDDAAPASRRKPNKPKQ